jgi:hypothetical protein
VRAREVVDDLCVCLSVCVCVCVCVCVFRGGHRVLGCADPDGRRHGRRAMLPRAEPSAMSAVRLRARKTPATCEISCKKSVGVGRSAGFFFAKKKDQAHAGLNFTIAYPKCYTFSDTDRAVHCKVIGFRFPCFHRRAGVVRVGRRRKRPRDARCRQVFWARSPST